MLIKASKILQLTAKLFYALNLESCVKRIIPKIIHTASDGCRMWHAIVSKLVCIEIVIGMILSEEYNILSQSFDLGSIIGVAYVTLDMI